MIFSSRSFIFFPHREAVFASGIKRTDRAIWFPGFANAPAMLDEVEVQFVAISGRDYCSEELMSFFRVGFGRQNTETAGHSENVRVHGKKWHPAAE
jgi:hypothetical protein